MQMFFIGLVANKSHWIIPNSPKRGRKAPKTRNKKTGSECFRFDCRLLVTAALAG